MTSILRRESAAVLITAGIYGTNHVLSTWIINKQRQTCKLFFELYITLHV